MTEGDKQTHRVVIIKHGVPMGKTGQKDMEEGRSDENEGF